METIAAIGLAGTIVQFLQFSLDLFSRSKQLYRSSQGALAEAVDTKVIANDLLKRINVLKAYASLTVQDVDEQLKLLCDRCKTVAEELLSILERVRVKGKRQKWPTFKAAILSVRTQPQVEDLKR
jgi:hypothetical protein